MIIFNFNSIEWMVIKFGFFYIGGFGGCVINFFCMVINIMVEDGFMVVCKDVSINLGESFILVDFDGGFFDNCVDFVLFLDVNLLVCELFGDNIILFFIEGVVG